MGDSSLIGSQMLISPFGRPYGEWVVNAFCASRWSFARLNRVTEAGPGSGKSLRGLIPGQLFKSPGINIGGAPW